MSILTSLYLRELDKTGVTQYNPIPIEERVITVTNEGITLNNKTLVLLFTDSHASYGVTRYTVRLGNTYLTESVVAPATSITVTGLPNDGAPFTLTLCSPPDYVDDVFTPVNATFTAATLLTASSEEVAENTQIVVDLKTVFDDYIDLSSIDFISESSRYTGTSAGGYYAYPATNALFLMYQQTYKKSYVQKAVDIAYNYINAGIDTAGNSYHTNTYYPKNTFKDWVWDRTATGIGRINHYSQEWRAGAMIAMALHTLKLQGGFEITPTNALDELYHFLSYHVWDKYSLNIAATNSPPVLESRSIETTVKTGQVACLCVIALIMDEYAGTSKGNNRYYNYYHQKLPVMVAEIVARGGFPGQHTDPDNWGGTETLDIGRAGDVFRALALSEKLGKTYITDEFRTAVGNNIQDNLYPIGTSNSIWTPEADGISESIWASSKGTEWAGWVPYILFNHVNRHANGYLGNTPITGLKTEIEVEIVAQLCTLRSVYS